MPMAPWEADDQVVSAKPAPWEAGDAPAAPAPPRNVSGGQVAIRAGRAAGNTGLAWGQFPVIAGAQALDWLGSSLFGTKPGAITQAYGDKFVVPQLAAAEDAALKPGENAGPVGNYILQAAPQIGKMAGDLLYGGMLGKAAGPLMEAGPALTRTAIALDMLRKGAPAGIPAGFRTAAEKQADLQHAGVDPLTAAIPAAVSGMTTIGQFALPPSAGSAAATLPARVLSRGAQGAAINVPAGVVQRQVDEAMLPAAARPTMASNPEDPATLLSDAVMGALFGQLGGKGAAIRAPNREALGYRPDPTLEPMVPPEPRPPAPVPLALVPEGAPTPVTAPDPLKAPIAPDWTLEGQKAPEPPRAPTVAEQVAKDDLAAATNQRVKAEEAFTLAEKRQAQADRDLRTKGEMSPDYQGGEAAHNPAEQVVRKVTLLDGQMPVMVESSDGKVAHVVFQNEDGTYTRGPVDARRLTEHDVPQNQRLSQDFQQRASEPRRGVGEQTMADERMPRPSTDRISSDAEPGTLKEAAPRDVGGDPEMLPRGDNKLPAPERAPWTQDQNAPRLEAPDAGRDAASPAGSRPGDATAWNRGNDGAANGRLGEAPGDANAVRNPTDAGNGRAPTATAAENRGNTRVADPREVPRPQVDYEKASTQAAKKRTTVANLEKEIGSKEYAAKNDKQKAAVNDKLANAKESLRRLEAYMADIAERLTPERMPVKEGDGLTLMQALRKEGGVTPAMARDMGIGGKDPKTVNGKGLKSEDQVVAALRKHGLAGDGESYADVVQRVRDELAGKESRSEGDLEAQAKAAARAEIEAEAKRAGIDTRDMTEGQILDALDNHLREGRADDEIAAADEAARVTREEDLNARSIDEVAEELGIPLKDIEDAKYAREAAVESRAAADEAGKPGDRPQGGEADRVPERSRPAQQAHADEVRNQPEPGNAADRTGSGQGGNGHGEARPAGGEAGGDSAGAPAKRVDEAFHRLNALPIDAAWRGIRDVVKHLFSDDSASGPLRQAFSDLWKAAGEAKPRELLARTLGTLVWSDASVVKSIAKARNSATLDKVWRTFSDMGGTEKVHGETFEQEVVARFQRNVNEVAGVMEGLSPAQVKQVKSLLENRAAINASAGGAHKAAAAIAKLLDAERAWLKSNGVEIGDTKDYFPRVYLAKEIQRRAADFKKAAEAAYREMGVDDPAKAADDWYNAIVLKGDGVPEVPFTDMSGDTPTKNFTKTREIPADVARRAGLDQFTDHDPVHVLSSYFRRTAKRGAFEARFGGVDDAGRGNAKWREMRKALEAEGNADMIGWVESKILNMSGQMRAEVRQMARDAASLARAVTVATFLRRAVVSSLTEPLQVANRTAAAGGHSALRNAVVMYAHGAERLARTFTGLGKSASEAERFRVAELLGTVLNHHLEGGVAAMRLDGDPVLNERGSVVSRVADRLTQGAMKASGLHDWTNANMVDSTVMGMDFVKQMAADSGTNKKFAAYELDRLGIPEADHAAFSKYAATVKSADQLVADMKAGNKQAAQYVGAIDKFTRQVIMRPTAADKPMLAKHPVAQMMYGLQSWMYSYWYNVQKANINQVKEAATGKGYTAGERATMAMAPVLYTAAVVAMTGAVVNVMRDLMSGRQKDKEREERSKKAHVGGIGVDTLRTLSQAQLFGLADPFVNSLTSARYDKQPGSELGGPLFGRAAKAGMMGAKLLTDKNSPNTNTPERQAAEATYNLWVDPMLALGSAALPMPAACAATFLSQRDELRQAFVNKVAGPKRARGDGDRWQ